MAQWSNNPQIKYKWRDFFEQEHSIEMHALGCDSIRVLSPLMAREIVLKSEIEGEPDKIWQFNEVFLGQIGFHFTHAHILCEPWQ